LLEFVKIFNGIFLKRHGVDVDLTVDKRELSKIGLLNGRSRLLTFEASVHILGSHGNVIHITDSELEVNWLHSNFGRTVDLKDMISTLECSLKVQVFPLASLLNLNFTIKDNETAMIEISWNGKVVLEVIGANREGNTHVVTDVLSHLGITDSLIGDFGHIVEDFFTETV
jgi:hypothetical protein